MKTVNDTSKAYGCPEHIAAVILSGGLPMLRAVRSLGPERVRWIGGPAPNCNDRSQERSLTCWALDGKRATQAELRAAAGGGR